MKIKKNMNIPGDGNLEESKMKMMSVLLEKLENFLESRTIPDDFCCPISLELMRDPVITSTGKTFERANIEKWLQGGGKCPVTQETLFRTSLTSNCALQSLIAKWHYIDGMEPLEKFGKSLSKLTFDKMEQEFCRGVPDEFVCYLSESQQPGNCQKSTKLMKDPVIICTGQTYERASIENWLKAGQRTCPLTKKILSSTFLIPNHALYSLISNWCEVNGLKPFKRSSSSDQGMVVSTDNAADARLHVLLSMLNSDIFEDRRSAAEEICYLAMHSYNTVLPLIDRLLFSTDTDTQKHAITTLHELSFAVRDSRDCIISSNVVRGIRHVLENGSMDARKEAALTFWSLSTLSTYRETLGQSGAIHALVKQLRDGNHGVKIASAQALYELCNYKRNQNVAIHAGIVSKLLGELTESSSSSSSMVDKALEIMKLLVSQPEGIAAIRDCRPMPVLLELLMIGSLRNKEIVLAILRQMQSFSALNDPHRAEAVELKQILYDLWDLNIKDDLTSEKAQDDFMTLLFPFR